MVDMPRLDEKGIGEEVHAAAVKSIVALQIREEMKKQHVSKVQMAERMQTSRAQLDRLLDPNNGGVTLETLIRAAQAVGCELRVELI